jgi:hypothetical protein
MTLAPSRALVDFAASNLLATIEPTSLCNQPEQVIAKR